MRLVISLVGLSPNDVDYVEKKETWNESEVDDHGTQNAESVFDGERVTLVEKNAESEGRGGKEDKGGNEWREKMESLRNRHGDIDVIVDHVAAAAIEKRWCPLKPWEGYRCSW
mmetsp:Transcript_24212/g.43368  ORF Transcript_24212/g.43368 Transcript_24212/m.43368 type:complete len:113 (-) Transcript_24212:1601-1939(-)